MRSLLAILAVGAVSYQLSDVHAGTFFRSYVFPLFLALSVLALCVWLMAWYRRRRKDGGGSDGGGSGFFSGFSGFGGDGEGGGDGGGGDGGGGD